MMVKTAYLQTLSVILSLSLTSASACQTPRHQAGATPALPPAVSPLPLQTWVEPVTQMEFVLLPAGSFRMGSPPQEIDREPAELYHQVRLSHSFYLGRYEVTQAEWAHVMHDNPSQFKDCGPRCPVERVNWYQVQEFITRLNRLSGGAKLRLPTEAEWEYACRAGTTTPFNTGANLTTAQANYQGDYPYAGFPKGDYRAQPLPVGSFAPNQWGLYDMHGNVWEWCQDWYCAYPPGPVVDPVGACQSALKVIRGGSWCFNAQSARSALRYTHNPKDLGYSLGFRLARAVAN